MTIVSKILELLERKGAASGYASLDASSVVVQQPPAIDAAKITSGRFGVARMPAGTSGQVLTAQGAGVDPAYAAAPGGETPAYLAGDLLIGYADAEQVNRTPSWVKQKEIRIGRAGTLRIKFDLRAEYGNNAYGKIYRNGGAVGTQRQQTSNSYINYSEDIAGWSVGDLVQLYCVTAIETHGAFVRNFRLYTQISRDSLQIILD